MCIVKASSEYCYVKGLKPPAMFVVTKADSLSPTLHFLNLRYWWPHVRIDIANVRTWKPLWLVKYDVVPLMVALEGTKMT